MKKVPIIGDLEESFDKSMKDLMGPFKTLYPALKIATIASAPTVLAGYVGYRSIPYLLDGLRSRAAIDCYKKAGKLVGKGIGGLGSMAFKFTKKSVMSLGALGKKQLDKLKAYSKEKETQRNLNSENSFDFSLEEAHHDTLVGLDINSNFEAENGFEITDNSLQQDFFAEPQIEPHEVDFEFNDDEIDLDCLNVSDDFAYRYTIDSNGAIKQYSVYKNCVCETPKNITREEYRNICSQYVEFEKNKEKDNSIEYDNELDM